MADNKTIQNKADQGAPQGGVPNGEAMETNDDAALETEKLKEEINILKAENSTLKEDLDAANQEMAKLKANDHSAPQIASQAFKVIKEYAGIKDGTIVESTDKSEIVHMVKQGYWKAK